MELIFNPSLWGDSREIPSSRHPPLHGEFEVSLVYLRPDLNSTLLLPHPPLLPHLPPLKQMVHRRETKNQSMRITFISRYKNLLLSLPPPQKAIHKRGKHKRKLPCLLLIADNYAFSPFSFLFFSATLKYFPYWHRELGVSRKAFSLSAQVCARNSIFLRSTTVASQFGCSWDSQK